VEIIQTGSGETIIFVHGLVGNRNAFKREYQYFCSDYQVVGYDLLGHGSDRGKEISFSLENLLAQLHDVYRQAGVEKAHLCTLSYGCYIANLFAAEYPEKVLSLCHIGGHYNNPSQLFDVFQSYWERIDDEYLLWLHQYSDAINPSVKGAFNPFALLSNAVYYKLGRQLYPTVLKDALGHRVLFDMKTCLATLKQPMLWVMGGYDHLYKTCLYDLDKIVPHVQYKELPLAGHAANIFRPGYFQKQYAEFLRMLKS